MKLTVVAFAIPRFLTVCVYVTLLPAATDVGDAEFVTTKSACAFVPTTSAAVAVLFALLGSVTDELTLAVSLIAVPDAVPAVTVST